MYSLNLTPSCRALGCQGRAAPGCRPQGLALMHPALMVACTPPMQDNRPQAERLLGHGEQLLQEWKSPDPIIREWR